MNAEISLGFPSGRPPPGDPVRCPADHEQGHAEGDLEQRRDFARARLEAVSDPAYLESLQGALGLDPGAHPL